MKNRKHAQEYRGVSMGPGDWLIHADAFLRPALMIMKKSNACSKWNATLEGMAILLRTSPRDEALAAVQTAVINELLHDCPDVVSSSDKKRAGVLRLVEIRQILFPAAFSLLCRYLRTCMADSHLGSFNTILWNNLLMPWASSPSDKPLDKAVKEWVTGLYISLFT